MLASTTTGFVLALLPKNKHSCVKNKLCADSEALPAHAWPLAKQCALCYSAFCFKGDISQYAVKQRKRNKMSSIVPMGNGRYKNSQYFVILQKEKKKSWKQIRLIAPIILKRIMILYLEKKSGTGFHNHMWKTLKGNWVGLPRQYGTKNYCLLFFLSSPQNTGGGKRSLTQRSSATTA